MNPGPALPAVELHPPHAPAVKAYGALLLMIAAAYGGRS